MNKQKDRREHAAAVRIAKLTSGKLTAVEEKELDDWIMEDDNHMAVFEKLINNPRSDWARNWFTERGVSSRLLKKKPEQWYKPEPDPRELREFYIGAAVGALGMLIVYLLMQFF